MFTAEKLANILINLTKEDLEDSLKVYQHIDQLFESKEVLKHITDEEIEAFEELTQLYSDEIMISVLYKKLTEEKVWGS